MLRKISLIGFKYPLLNGAHTIKVATGGKLRHNRRHSTHKIILAQTLFKFRPEHCYGRPIFRLQQIGHVLLAHSIEEFEKRERIQRQKVDFSHRK